MKRNIIFISIILISISIPGCLNNDYDNRDDLVISMVNLEMDVYITIEDQILNESVLLIPTIVNSKNEPLEIRSMEVDDIDQEPIMELSGKGNVINITKLLKKGNNIINIHYRSYEIEDRYSIQDVLKENDTRFFMDTPGFSIWDDRTVLVFSNYLEGGISLGFTRGGDYLVIDDTGEPRELRNGWNHYPIERGWNDCIG